MGSIPQLSDVQWRRIENILPENRRDRQVICALMYREFSGQSLRHVGGQYGLSRTRLDEWSRALKADGSLPQLMRLLKLKLASSLPRRGGGRAWYHHNKALVAEVTAIKLAEFRQALRL